MAHRPRQLPRRVPPLLAAIAAALAAMVAVAAGAAAPSAAAPRRVLSLNLCADQLLMVLLPPERIASITWLSRSEGDPALMPLARRLPVNHGTAEEVLVARPDLVIAGRYTTSATRALLRRAGVPLLEIDSARDWEDIRRLTRSIAAAVGEPARGEALIEEMDGRLAGLERTRPDRPLRVIGWSGSGNDVPGRDTLFNTLLESAGGVNVGVLPPGGGVFDVERVVMARPEALLRGLAYGGTPALRNEAARHPLLRRLYPQGQLTYPEALFGCGVPRAAVAAQDLQRSLRGISSSAARR